MPDDFDYSKFDYSKPRDARPTAEAQPLLTYLLVALSVMVTGAFFAPGSEPGTFLYRLGHLGFGSSLDIWNGHYYFLVTAIFNHLSLMHIVFNMLWLLQLGRILESTLKPWQYALFVLGAAVVGSCSEMMIGSNGVGMSGVVYAMFGLLWAGRGAYPSWSAVATRNNLNLFIGWGVLCVFLTYTNIMRIGNGAHAGGFLFGLCIGWLFVAPRRRPIWWMPLAGLMAVCVLALTWVPWSPDWKWRQYSQAFDKASRAFESHDYPQSIALFEQALTHMPHEESAERNIEYAWHNMVAAALKRNDPKAAEAAMKQEEQAKVRADSDMKPGQAGEDTPASDDSDTHKRSKPGKEQ